MTFLFPFEQLMLQGLGIGRDFDAELENSARHPALILTCGGLCLGLIASVALEALGFRKASTIIATATSVTIGAIGVVGLLFYSSVFISYVLANARR
jgi:hypothetical protein